MISDKLRKEVLKADSIYSVAKGAGLDYKVVYDFVHHGRDIRLSSVDLICRFLKLDLRGTR